MIELVDIHKSFGTQKVLDGLNLQIPDGKITVLLGRSGSGKSVTLKHIIGLMRPDSGQVFVDGEDITKVSAWRLNQIRKKFGMLFQEAALFDSMTVMENVAFPLVEHTKLKWDEIERTVREKLKQVGLEGAEYKFPSQLSGGMKRRVGLARAIILEPQILLCDEPTSGLDPIVAEAITDLLIEMQRSLSVTMFIISHDTQLALKVADQIAFLYSGRIHFVGTPQEAVESDNPFVQQFIKRTTMGPMALEGY